MKFYPVPKFPCSTADLQEFRSLLSIPRNIHLFPNRDLVNGIEADEGIIFKPWMDTQAIWKTDEYLKYIFIYPTAIHLELTYRLVTGDAGAKIPDVAGLSMLETAGYSAKAIKFYSQRVLAAKGGDFSLVPRLWIRETPRKSAESLNLVISGGPDVNWPIGTLTGDANSPNTINPEVAFRLNPITEWPEAFFIDDYDREFPLDAAAPAVTPASGTNPTLSPKALVDGVMDILEAQMPVDATAAAIRKLALK